jgi:hypothetical protein
VTFVVGREFTSGLQVAGDLRVLVCDEVRRGYAVAALKTVILSDDLLVAYSGNVEVALATLRALPSARQEANATARALSDSCVAANGKVEYLLAQRPGRLMRVTEESIEDDLETGWVGSQQAWTIYQEAYANAVTGPPLRISGISPEGPLPLPAEDWDALQRMNAGIVAVVQAELNDVGEAMVFATASTPGFHYQPQAVLEATHEQVISGEGWVPSDWGSAATGGFGYSVMTPTGSGIGAIALYFPHGQLGLLYAPLVQDEPISYRQISQGDFRSKVAEEYGIYVDGPRF